MKNSNDIKDKTILIVDDVLTTSATINEISKVLLEHNANKIYFLTITSKKNIN
ncbi:ComF family protein [Anaerofustis stercorihominis]|uniref:ComF family protein n=1 Tax=Anaerofustis stercorihominis TaxID=214853 RepID=UPI003995BB7D